MSRAAVALGGAALILTAACRDQDRERPAAARPVPRAPSTPALPAPPRRAIALPDATGAVGCPDPIAGLWVGRVHTGEQWDEYRLTLSRVGRALTCAQESRAWLGPVDQRRPPPCPSGEPDLFQWTLACRAVERAGELVVRATRVLASAAPCNDASGSYLLDAWRGRVDGNTWAADNSFDPGDGTVDHQAVTFHRLACAP